MKYPPITLKLLKSKEACKQIKIFEEAFGNEPALLSNGIAVKFSDVFDFEWAARNLLNSDDFVHYNAITSPAYIECVKTIEHCEDEFTQNISQALRNYYKTFEVKC
jgi:hypothetical protein